LPNADDHPIDFWREVERRTADIPTTFPVGSVGDLVERYRASEEFKSKSSSTQSSYSVHLRRFSSPEAWGLLRVRDLTAAGVLAARDALKATPGMANHMLSCGRTLWNWAIPLDMAEHNPFEKVKPFGVPDRGHVPWPQWVTDFVIEHAPPDLLRLTRLGIMTCQRESDLIRMSPEHRERNGIWCRPKKHGAAAERFIFLCKPLMCSSLTVGPKRPSLLQILVGSHQSRDTVSTYTSTRRAERPTPKQA
jgi:hypothetical protein